MKSATRRQVKTPVGNKTKRGAELESTPKTPRSLEASPAKPSCINGFSQQEQDDRRPQLRSKRPLQWNSIPKQKMVGDVELKGENTMSPSHQQAQVKYTGESKAVSALSPICVNAIHGNAGLQGGERKTGIKKPNELPLAVTSPTIRNCDDGDDRKCHGKTKALDCNGRQDEDDAGSTDEGSCSSSPDMPSCGNQMFFWSNAAFNTDEPGQDEAVSGSKDAAPSSSRSSSASSSQQNAGIIVRADSEAESRYCDSSAENGYAEKIYQDNGKQNETMLPEACVSMDTVQRSSSSKFKAAENVKREHAHGGKSDASEISSNKRKNLNVSSKSFATAKNSETEQARNLNFLPFSSPVMTKQIHGLKKAGNGAENEEEAMKGGLDEIQQEIERLTERLAELHLQKRKREEELQRQKQAKNEKAIEKLVKDDELHPRNDEKSRQEKRAGAGVSGRTKEFNGVSSSRGSSVRESPKTKPQKTPGLASRSREESPLVSMGRRIQGPAHSVSKLAEMRRSVSVSSTGRRMERSKSDERTKALRRLSLSEAATPSAELKSQQLGTIKSVASKGVTPSRVVSSRYGRAITPDACRPCAPTGSTTPSKKRDRPLFASGSAASSPLPAQPQPSPSPSTSITCSPLKRAATLRSGYPSRSGFSTPTKDRQAIVKPTAMVSCSVQLPPSTLSSSLTKSQDRTRLLLSSPRCMSPLPRLDSPKSTAALYKCLESLLEDSKHFFKRLSPVRSSRLPQLQENAIAAVAALSPARRSINHLPQLPGNAIAASLASPTSLSTCDCSPKRLLAAMENSLPAINTCRLDAMSPRDSGCVKRTSDRQKKRFYFAQDDSIPRALEGNLRSAGVLST